MKLSLWWYGIVWWQKFVTVLVNHVKSSPQNDEILWSKTQYDSFWFLHNDECRSIRHSGISRSRAWRQQFTRVGFRLVYFFCHINTIFMAMNILLHLTQYSLDGIFFFQLHNSTGIGHRTQWSRNFGIFTFSFFFRQRKIIRKNRNFGASKGRIDCPR